MSGIVLPEYIFGAVLQGVSMFVRERQRRNIPVPAEVLAAHQWLTIMAATPKMCSAAADMHDVELIDGPTTAEIIGVTARHVQRIHADLGGVLPEGSRAYVFDRKRVLEYAKERRAHLGMSADGHQNRSN